MTLQSILSFHHFQVKMIQLKLPHDLPDNLAEIRQMQLNDRRLMTKANEAYDNYVLSYMKHECPDLVRGVVGAFFQQRCFHDCIPSN